MDADDEIAGLVTERADCVQRVSDIDAEICRGMPVDNRTGSAKWGERRRKKNAAAGRCVNDTVVPSHGPPVAGQRRCQACKDVHKKSRDGYRKRRDAWEGR